MPRVFFTILPRRATGIITPLLALAALGCGEEGDPPAGPPQPPQAALKVSTATTGTDVDPDGYVFPIDGGPGQPIGVNGSRTLALATAGANTVKLDGVADNCAVAGSNPRQVSVTAATQSDVAFTTSCTGTASIVVTTTTSGPAADPDGYTVTVNSVAAGAIGPNESKTFTLGVAGAYTVGLGGIAANCASDGR